MLHSRYWLMLGIVLLGATSGGGSEAEGARRAKVAERRAGPYVICHRGAAEFAHENTLEAYRAALELGADGNEIDIRMTRDGVLVCFHDDMLDRLLEAFGDVSDYPWDELQRFVFRDPRQFGAQCRIPTLEEVLELHRQHAALLHLDIKRPQLDRAIAALLDRLDLWDHVVACNAETGGVILKDARLRLGRYQGGLYLDRGEVFPAAIAAVLARPGDGVIVDDPRGVVLALGRKLGRPSRKPVAPRDIARLAPPRASTSELLARLRDAPDWSHVAETEADRRASAQRIVARAQAADGLRTIRAASPEVFAALAERVTHRSLHKEWMVHGLDGAIALRTLLVLQAPQAVAAAREALWRDDPALEPVVNPQFKNPRAWTDFRGKMLAFPALAHCPGEAAEKLCRDYLALTDDAAARLGPPQFEEAARTLLVLSPRTETAVELLQHRLQLVRGRAVLDCLAHGSEPWARAALKAAVPHALAYWIDEGAPK